jgi:hypothetical protein
MYACVPICIRIRIYIRSLFWIFNGFPVVMWYKRLLINAAEPLPIICKPQHHGARHAFHTYPHVHTFKCMHVYACAYIQMYACAYTQMYACAHIQMYACAHVQMYACVCMCIHTNVHTFKCMRAVSATRSESIMEQGMS